MSGKKLLLKYEELQEAIIKYLDNRPDDEQGTIEERSKFEPIKEKLEILLGVEAGRWGWQKMNNDIKINARECIAWWLAGVFIVSYIIMLFKYVDLLARCKWPKPT